uniref:hypothetical protein n=1 Tax=Candidatus Tripitaka californicus TaxID=3367616 RepID=UPI00402550E1
MGLALLALLFVFSYSLVVFSERAGEAEGVEGVVVLNHTGELRSREREKKELVVPSMEGKQRALELAYEVHEEKFGDVKRAIDDGNLSELEVLEYVKEYL